MSDIMLTCQRCGNEQALFEITDNHQAECKSCHAVYDFHIYLSLAHFPVDCPECKAKQSVIINAKDLTEPQCAACGSCFTLKTKLAPNQQTEYSLLKQ